MAEIIEDRVKETTISTGTGAITLAGAMLGFRTFASVCAVNDTFHAGIVAVDANGNPTGAWEIGYYTYSATNTITRTSVRASSNANALVNFAAGTKQIFLDLPAYQIKSFATVSTSNASAKPYITDSSLAASVFTALTFADEFDGNTLDTTKWTHYSTEAPDNATQNWNVSGGTLNVWPQIDGTSSFFNRSINTDGKAFHKYGFTEARVKLPVGAGVWAGFEMLSNENGVFPRIDLYEAYPGGGTALPWGTATNQPVNYRGNVMNNTSPVVYVTSRRFRDFVTSTTTILSDDFHTYGVYWTPDTVQYYFDGAAWGTPITITSVANLQQRMFFNVLLRFNTVDSGTASIANTPQGITNAMKVDYVRAWGLATTSGGGSGGGGSGGLTIQQVTTGQQATTHEATLIRTDYEWERNPTVITEGPYKELLPSWYVSEMGGAAYAALPSGLTKFLSWLVIERGTSHASTNAAVELRNIRLYIYSQARRVWEQHELTPVPLVDLWRHAQEGGGATYQPVADGQAAGVVRYTSTTATARFPGTTVSGVSSANQMFHGYGNGITVDPADWRALYIALDHRLTLWDSGGTDDRATSQYMVQIGGDHYPPSFSWGAVGYAPGAGGGRFRIVKNEWQTSYCIIPYFGRGSSWAEMNANSPPLGFLP